MITNCFTLAMAQLTALNEPGVTRTRMDMAVHAEIPLRRDVPDWRMVVREDARQLAMLSLWGMLAGGIKSYDQILNATQIQCKIVNHYVISAERREFEEEFRREVLDRLDLLPI